jgi:hypothetical protein
MGAGLLLLAIFAVTGCGGGKATLKGKVTLNDKPLPYGTVHVWAKQDNQHLMGPIKEDGSYEISDVPTGTATITVTFPAPAKGGSDATAKVLGAGGKDKPDMSRMKEDAEKAAKQSKEQAEGFKKVGGPIPNDYTNPDKKKLTTEVKGGTHVFDIEMKK